MLDQNIKPSAIVKSLDQYVIGQEDAKKIPRGRRLFALQEIARSRATDAPIVKSNVLLIGSTGTGKTLLCETLSRILGAPFVTAEATSLAQTASSTRKSRPSCSGCSTRPTAMSRRPSTGIVFIDEIDKLKAPDAAAQQRGSGESVQHALLKIMEGSQVKLGAAGTTSTRPTSCSSAAARLSDWTRSCSHTQAYGFISIVR